MDLAMVEAVERWMRGMGGAVTLPPRSLLSPTLPYRGWKEGWSDHPSLPFPSRSTLLSLLSLLTLVPCPTHRQDSLHTLHAFLRTTNPTLLYSAWCRVG